MPSANFSTFSATAPVVTLGNVAALDVDAADEAFPGPLYLDSGWNKALQVKKRREIVAWLDRRIEEREKAAHFLAAATAGDDDAEIKRHRALDRTVLLRLLKALVEGEGKISGSCVRPASS
jgi:hypothetical protein